MAVIVKKAEKVAAVVSSLPVGFSFEAFLEAFQAAYPKEWANVVREYQKHERKTKPGKAHPMPEPVQYMRNALNVHLRGLPRRNAQRKPPDSCSYLTRGNGT